jgi:hypothetical protein
MLHLLPIDIEIVVEYLFPAYNSLTMEQCKVLWGKCIRWIRVVVWLHEEEERVAYQCPE